MAGISLYLLFLDPFFVRVLRSAGFPPILVSTFLALVAIMMMALTLRSISIKTVLRLLGLFLIPSITLTVLKRPSHFVWFDLIVLVFVFAANKRLVRLILFQRGVVRTDGIYLLSMVNILYLYTIYRAIELQLKLTWGDLILALGAAFVATVVSFYIGRRFRLFRFTYRPVNFRDLFIAAVHSFLFIAFGEEFFFRFSFFNIFNTLIPGWTPWFGLLLSTFFFGGVHFAGGFRHVLISIFLGFIIGMVYIVTQSLSAAIITHGLATVIRILYVDFSLTAEPAVETGLGEG